MYEKKVESLIKKLETSSLKMRFLNIFRRDTVLPSLNLTKCQALLSEYNNLATPTVLPTLRALK